MFNAVIFYCKYLYIDVEILNNSPAGGELEEDRTAQTPPVY